MPIVVVDQHGQRQDSSIELQTREGDDIENNQCWNLTFFYQSLAKAQLSEFPPPGAIHRTPPCPIYNCHGLTFASRRATIWRPEDLATILDRDGYLEISRDKVIAGDIVLYYEDGDISHSGLIVEVAQHEITGREFRVVSKWGHGTEVLHWLRRCPYKSDVVKFFRMQWHD